MAVGLSVDIAANAKALSRGFRGAERDIDIFGKKISGSLAKAFRLSGVGLAAGFTAGAAGITSLIKDIDAAQKILVSSTGATGSALKGLEADVRAVARTVPQGAAEIAGLVGQVSNLFGATGKTGQELAKLSLDFNRLTGVEGAEAVNKVAGAMRLFGVETSQADDVLGDIIKASQRFGVSSRDIINGLEGYAGTFNQLGFHLDESILLMAQFQRAGIPITKIGEGLAQFIPNVLKAGGDVRSEFERWIDLFSQGEQGVYDFNDAVKLFGAESINALIAAAPHLDLSATLGNNTGLVTKLGEEALTVGERFAIVGNQVETAFIPIAESLIPVIENLADATGGFVETWTDEGLTTAIGDAKAALADFLDTRAGDTGLGQLTSEVIAFGRVVNDTRDDILGAALDIADIVRGIREGTGDDNWDRLFGLAADALGAGRFLFADLPNDIAFQFGSVLRGEFGKTGLIDVGGDLQHVTDRLNQELRNRTQVEALDLERVLRAGPDPRQFDFGGVIAAGSIEAARQAGLLLSTPADQLSAAAGELSDAGAALNPLDPDTDPSLSAAEVVERYLASQRERATPGGLQDALEEWSDRQGDFTEGFSQVLQDGLDDFAAQVEEARTAALEAELPFDEEGIKFDTDSLFTEFDAYWETRFPGLDLDPDDRLRLLEGGLDLDDADLIDALNRLTSAMGGFVPGGGGGGGGAGRQPGQLPGETRTEFEARIEGAYGVSPLRGTGAAGRVALTARSPQQEVGAFLRAQGVPEEQIAAITGETVDLTGGRARLTSATTPLALGRGGGFGPGVRFNPATGQLEQVGGGRSAAAQRADFTRAITGVSAGVAGPGGLFGTGQRSAAEQRADFLAASAADPFSGLSGSAAGRALGDALGFGPGVGGAGGVDIGAGDAGPSGFLQESAQVARAAEQQTRAATRAAAAATTSATAASETATETERTLRATTGAEHRFRASTTGGQRAATTPGTSLSQLTGTVTAQDRSVARESTRLAQQARRGTFETFNIYEESNVINRGLRGILGGDPFLGEGERAGMFEAGAEGGDGFRQAGTIILPEGTDPQAAADAFKRLVDLGIPTDQIGTLTTPGGF